ncbi:MAG TPA: aspartate-semialdehyde dehydrogenase [Bacteroidetes bacterium]|nr:aspartate-semialdehyde dehydrogenase [Bacteroidota bacterium]
MEKLRVGVLGATGAVGQQFIALLKNHPWFRVTALAASERSAGKTYREAANWILQTPIPENSVNMKVLPPQPEFNCDFVFSGLDSSVAREIEWKFAVAGIPVISNAKNHRLDPLIPLLIPEVNPGHISLIQLQREKYGFGSGFIVTNPNCTTVGLAMGVLPVFQQFGIRKMLVTTLQAISGAGYPGVASLDILGNVIPNISGEAEKIRSEPLKIFGKLRENKIFPAEISISAQCNRVPVRNGHLISVSLATDRAADLEAVFSAYSDFVSPLTKWKLPGAPQHPIRLTDQSFDPQPFAQVDRDNGMTVSVGQVQSCPVLDFRLVALVHNTIRGAAGGAILNAEWLKANGFLGGVDNR